MIDTYLAVLVYLYKSYQHQYLYISFICVAAVNGTMVFMNVINRILHHCCCGVGYYLHVTCTEICTFAFFTAANVL